MSDLKEIRIFVASPGDVRVERERLDRVRERLNVAYASVVRFNTFRWEQKYYKAHLDFQSQIVKPADCDIVVVLFANRLGSRLPEEFMERLPDGTPYPSGTAYELLTAIAAADQRGKPDVYVFRKTSEPTFSMSQRAELGRRSPNKLGSTNSSDDGSASTIAIGARSTSSPIRTRSSARSRICCANGPKRTC